MNKVYSLLAAAFCLVAFSCAKQEIDNPASVGKTTRVKVKASIELPAGMTKSTISGSSFLWSKYDQIACYTTTGSFQNSEPLESEDITDAGLSARFWFSLTGDNPHLADVAVFPVFPDKPNKPTYKPTYDTETLTIKIPDTIAWVDGEVDNIEVAYFGGSSLTQNINLNFVNVAGIIKFTLNNLPVGANQVFFKTGKTITGDFVIENLSTKWSEYTSQQYDNLYISAGENSDTDGITFTFDEVKEAGTSKVFYVPVPTGTYSQIGFKVQNNDGETVTNLWKKTATVSNTVGRGTMLVMPALTFASATGGGEGNPTNIITTLSGQTGAVALPSTTESVLVEMNTTAGALDLEYADGGEKPANVYVKVLTDATVNTLNINLPNSTVYVNGLENSNVGTLSSVTAESTLKVLASPLTIGKATINQGNVEIGGTVNSVVVAEGATSDGQSAGAGNQVQIFVTKEAALQTITLNAKTDVVVEQPKDNIDAAATENKVYVIVNAVGSSATAQNGGDIYVTANANCTVTAGGGDSEPSANGSTATIDNTGSGTATQSEKSGGAIDTGELKKAQIGETKYATLAAAITAANANDEIVILVDQTVKQGYTITKNLTINLNGKTLTANAVSDSDSNFTNNRLFHVEGSNIDFTINNGTIVLDEHIWGTVRFISQGGNLALTDVTTYNFREWGANIKLSYGHAAFNNVIMHSDKGGCVDIGDGASSSAPSGATAEMTDCIFDQTNEGSTATYKTVSAAIITSYSGHVTLNSGTYSAYYALFPHSSGGTITVKDGCTITGRQNAVHTVDHGHTTTQEDHIINIEGGTINGAFDVATDGHTTFSITGGTFDHDPSAYCAAGYAATPTGANTWTVAKVSAPVAIGSTGYETLAAAVDAAQDGQTVTILQAGEYAIPAITKNLIIDAAVSGVVVEHTTNTTIATIASGKTATFKNITFNLGDTQNATLHGFGTSASSGALVMNGCTINGALSLFGVSTFTNCTFAVSGTTKYNIWSVNSDASFTGCSFTNTNRAVNVYDRLHGSVTKNVSFSNCSFAGTEAKKAAINVHHNPDNLAAGAKYAVSINNCTTTGTWASSTAQTGEAETTICNSALWMVSDLKNYVLGDITVSVNGVAQDLSWGAAKIGDVRYASLKDAIAAAEAGATITILKDQTVTEGFTITKNLTIDLNEKTLTANAASDSDSKFPRVRLFHVTGATNFALLNGTVTTNSHIWGSVRFDSTGELTLSNLTANNSRPWGANIKMGTGHATFTNVNINSYIGGCVDIGDGEPYSERSGAVAEMTNCTFLQTGVGADSNEKTMSSAVVLSRSGHAILNSGTYSGYHALYPHSSAGTVIVKEGCIVTGTNDVVRTEALGSYAGVQEDNCIIIEGGTFSGAYAIATDGHTTFSITGGTFDHDPSAFVAPGYAAQENAGIWTIVEAPIYAGGDSGNTLAEAVALVKAANGGIIKLLGDVEVSSYIRVEAPTVLDLNGFNVNASSPLFNYVTADLTIRDSGENGTMNVNVGSSRYAIRSEKSGVKIKLEGGTLSAYSTSTYVHAVQVSSGATFEMTGGKIIVPSTSTASYNYCLVVDSNDSNAIISGGEIIGEATGGNYAINNSGTVNISGGFVSGKAATGSNWWQSYYPYVLYGSGTYNISGGRVKAIGWENYGQSAHFFGDGTHASITGGFFGGVDIEDSNSRAEVSSRVASGYQIVNLTSSDPEYANGYRYKVVAQ